MAEGRPVGRGGRSRGLGAAARAALSAIVPAELAAPLAAALVPLPRLQEESSPAPPAAAANRRNARRPWTLAIASAFPSTCLPV